MRSGAGVGSSEADHVLAAGQLAAGETPSRPNYGALRAYLARQVARVSSVDRAEAEDIVDESLARFIVVAAAGGVRPDTALAYLRRIVRNEAIDRLRKQRNEVAESLEEHPASDDAIARMIESTATASLIEAALTLAARSKDQVCTRVANEWLREAALQGASPSTREVARRAEVSHTTVQNALARLRGYLQEVSEQ